MLQKDISINDEIYWNDNEGNKEYFLYDSEINKFYFYDFTLKNKKIMIEYHGEAFHPRKDKLSESEWKNWKVPFNNQSADEKYSFDQQKKSFAESKGFSVIEVWGSDDYSKSLEKIVKLL